MAEIINLFPDRISLLLPYYFYKGFRDIFASIGFNLICAASKNELDTKIKNHHIDLAIEWQHGERDFVIRDLLRKHGKRANIMLALNWNREVPQDFSSLGYFSALKVPFNISELRSVCYEALLPARREKFKKLLLWRRDH